MDPVLGRREVFRRAVQRPGLRQPADQRAVLLGDGLHRHQGAPSEVQRNIGAGAESRQQIGWVIVGGMSLGTLLTIFVVPTMYTLFARRTVPGANKTVGKEQVDDATGTLIQPMHPVMGAELVVK